MPTIKDLGREQKLKFPNEKRYAAMSDEDLGRLVKARYPETYKDYTDEAVQTYYAQPVAPQYPAPPQPQNYPQRYQQPYPPMEQHFQEILDYYRPDRGRFTSWYQRIRAEGRTKLEGALTNELQTAIQNGMLWEQALQDRTRSRVEFEKWLQEHALTFIQLRHQMENLWVRLEREKAVEEAQHKVTTTILAGAAQANLMPTDYSEVQKKKAMNEAERAHEAGIAADEVRMNIYAHLLKDHQQMTEIQTLIDNTILEMAEIKRGFFRGQPIDEWAAAQILASRKESIEAWEADKRGIQERLRQRNVQQVVERNTYSSVHE